MQLIIKKKELELTRKIFHTKQQHYNISDITAIILSTF